jgi:hypothetical protein
MIPIFLILAVINAVLASAIALRIFYTDYTDRAQSQAHRRKFSAFYALFALAWVSWSLVYVPRDLLVKNLLDLTGYLFLTGAMVALVQTPFTLRGHERLGRRFGWTIAVLGLAYAAGRLAAFAPADRLTYGIRYYMWAPARVLWLDLVLGVTIIVSAVTTIVELYFVGRPRAAGATGATSLRVSLSKIILFSSVFIAVFLLSHTLLAYSVAALLVAVNLTLTLFALTLQVAPPTPASPAAGSDARPDRAPAAR